MEIKKNKQQKEGPNRSVGNKVTAVPNAAGQHYPEGTKPGIRKKTRKPKKQTILPEIKLFDVPTSNQKIPPPKKEEKEEKIPADKYLYVYGITNHQTFELDFKGLKDQLIQKLDLNEITVLFSFYPTLHPMVEEKEALLHAEILNKLAGKITIVPMAFGTVFKEQEILKTVLTKSYPEVKKTLELIKDKFELGIKVIKREDLSEEASQETLKQLNELSVKSVAGDKFSERLLLNNSFLVEKSKFAQFSDKVGELEQKYPQLKFIYTGPWPAYSFVDINIKVG